MRILLINWQDIKHPRAGGAEVHMHDIFGRIAQMGHFVDAIVCNFPGGEKFEVIDGIRIHRIGNRNTFNLILPFYYWTSFRKKHYDVVVLDINKIPFFTLLLDKTPKLILVHHLFGKSIFVETNPIIGSYVYLTEKLFLSITKNYHYVAVSPSTSEELKRHGINNISIIPNCVDTNKYKPITQKAPVPTIGFVGRLVKYKSIEHLLLAFPAVKEQFSEAKLVIVGDGPYRQELEKKAHELGLNDVIFTGFISEEEKIRWLNKMWVVVNTSVKEGWGLTVVEANACGTPVIAANSPGLRDSVKDGETGLLYRYGDVDELSRKLIFILKDLTIRQKLSKNAINWANSFNCDKISQKFLTLLEQLKTI